MPKGLAFARSTPSGASREARHRRRVDHGLSTRSGSLERGLPAEEAMNVTSRSSTGATAGRRIYLSTTLEGSTRP